MVVLKETRKIILVLTDGLPDSRQSCLDAIAMCRKLGIEVYGIGKRVLVEPKGLVGYTKQRKDAQGIIVVRPMDCGK